MLEVMFTIILIPVAIAAWALCISLICLLWENWMEGRR